MAKNVSGHIREKKGLYYATYTAQYGNFALDKQSAVPPDVEMMEGGLINGC